MTATVTNWNAEGSECSLVLDENPLVEFVELPEAYAKLNYCGILCGVLRGALEQVRGSGRQERGVGRGGPVRWQADDEDDPLLESPEG